MCKENFLTGETNKNPLLYKVNELMIFKITPKCDEEFLNTHKFKKYKWRIMGDDGKEETGSSPLFNQESLIINTYLTCPGFVRVFVEACDDNLKPIENVKPFEGGAGAEVEKIVCDTAMPKDLDEFWGKIKSDIDNFGVSVLEKNICEACDEEFDVYKVKLDMPYGKAVWGYLTIPKNAKEKSLCAKVVYCGYGVGGLPPTTEKDCIVFTNDAHGLEPGLSEEYYNDLNREPDGELYYYGFCNIENSNPNNVYFKNMIARDLMAANFLKTLPEWNKKDLVADGGSQGAFRSTCVAAIDKDITFLNIHIPWLCNLGGYKKGRIRGWCPDYTEGLCYYDTAIQATRVKCRANIEARLGDYTCPPSGVMALYNNIKGKKKITFYQNGTHGYLCPVHEKYILE